MLENWWRPPLLVEMLGTDYSGRTHDMVAALWSHCFSSSLIRKDMPPPTKIRTNFLRLTSKQTFCILDSFSRLHEEHKQVEQQWHSIPWDLWWQQSSVSPLQNFSSLVHTVWSWPGLGHQHGSSQPRIQFLGHAAKGLSLSWTPRLKLQLTAEENIKGVHQFRP